MFRGVALEVRLAVRELVLEPDEVWLEARPAGTHKGAMVRQLMSCESDCKRGSSSSIHDEPFLVICNARVQGLGLVYACAMLVLRLKNTIKNILTTDKYEKLKQLFSIG